MDYDIGFTTCDDCENEWLSIGGGLELIEKQHPEWRGIDGSVKHEYNDVWRDAYNGTPQVLCAMIFCGEGAGDHALCHKHLIERINALDKPSDK